MPPPPSSKICSLLGGANNENITIKKNPSKSFEAEDFLKIFLAFSPFSASFSY